MGSERVIDLKSVEIFQIDTRIIVISTYLSHILQFHKYAGMFVRSVIDQINLSCSMSGNAP